MKKAYHLDLDEGKIEGAKFVILTGEPQRVPLIAKTFDEEAREIANNREFCTYIGKINNKPVLVTSTGIGGPSTSIAIDELAQIGIKVFLRIGTTGAIQKNIKIGDVIITTGAVRLDGASTHYAPVEYPAVSDFEIVKALVESAEELGIKYHLGITASTDTFYPGQERYNSYSGYVIKRFQNSMKELQELKVLNYEMESSTVLVLCSVFGLKGGCVTGVIVNRTESEEVKDENKKLGEKKAINVGIKAMGKLVNSLKFL
jgi:uridine phosphorylase